MASEIKGQYYFSEEKGYFKTQHKPLGIHHPSLIERLKENLVFGLENINSKSIADLEMKELHKTLLKDLKEKGILGIIERETNTNPDQWIDHETYRHFKPLPHRKANNWEVEITGPGYDYIETQGPGRWSGGCVSIGQIPRTYTKIQLSIGEEWNERLVNIIYESDKKLTIAGERGSTIDLNQQNTRHLFQEHLRDAMANPYNPYYETTGGFLSPAAFKRHLYQLNANARI